MGTRPSTCLASSEDTLTLHSWETGDRCAGKVDRGAQRGQPPGRPTPAGPGRGAGERCGRQGLLLQEEAFPGEPPRTPAEAESCWEGSCPWTRNSLRDTPTLSKLFPPSQDTARVTHRASGTVGERVPSLA